MRRKTGGLVLALMFTALTLNAAADVTAKTADNGRVGLVFAEDVTPLFTIAAGEDAGIYLMTGDEKHYLTGNPQTTQPGSFCDTWKVDGRIVTVAVTGKDGRYDLSLKAQPSDGITGWGISVAAEPDEYFTGLMERVVDGPQGNSWRTGMTEAMNLRGQTVNMKVDYTVGLYAPFYLSSRGYGLFTHGTWTGKYSFPSEGQSGNVEIFFEGPTCEYTLYTGDPGQVVRAHLMETGPSFLPPKWALRPYRWRDDHVQRDTYYDGSKVHAPYNSELVEDVLMMEALGIPCGVYWVDRPWGKNDSGFGYDDLEYDEQRLPHTKQMIQWLNKRDIKFLLWICPWAVGEKMEAEAFDKGYVIASPDAPFKGGDRSNFIDLTNPKAVAWWQGYLRKLLEDGVAGFKMDRGEERSPLLLKTNQTVYDGRTGRQMYNDYIRLYAKAANEVCQEVRGDDFVIFPRSGYTGSTKYAAFWAGDTYGNPWGLRSAIIGGLRSAVIGYPIWGSDTGGYSYREKINGKTQKSFLPKIGCRWLAFSCFSPIMEVGPTANKGPWAIDDTLTAVWRMYAILHDNLLDYTYQCVKAAHDTGMPVMRPLFLAYPDQKQAWDNWQTYLYGPDILVCPAWQDDDVVTQKVYLPAGEQWIDAWDTANVLDGGQTVAVQCPVYKIPIYIRKGSDVKLGDLNALWAESVNVVKNKPTMAELEKRAGFSEE